MIDKRLARLWSEQKASEVNKLLDKSYEEFVARLKRRPAWRAWAPWNILTDWSDANPVPVLDTAVFVSPPSAAKQTTMTAAIGVSTPYSKTVTSAFMTLRAVLNVPQGLITLSFRGDTGQNPFLFIRNQAALGVGYSDFYAYWWKQSDGTPVGGGGAQLDKVVAGAFTFQAATGVPIGEGVLTWQQVKLVFWSDPTLGFICRGSELSPTAVTAPDIVDAADSFKSSATNRITVGNYSMGNCWYDDFQLLTP